MDCRELRPMFDSYTSDELLIETNHEVLRHLENCTACRGEMAERRSLKLRLRHAVRNASEMQIVPAFSRQLSASLQETALRPGLFARFAESGRSLNPRLALAGFAVLAFAVVGTFMMLDRPAPLSISAGIENKNANTELANAVRVSWQELTSHAVGDHKNCAIEFHLKEGPISLEDAAAKYAAYNKDLDKVIMAAFKADKNPSMSRDTQFIEAHSCMYEGRQFAHVVVRHKGKVVSLLVTDTDLPGGADVTTANFARGMNAAGFQIGHHAVFVVSQLANADNIALAKSVEPAVRLHVEKQSA